MKTPVSMQLEELTKFVANNIGHLCKELQTFYGLGLVEGLPLMRKARLILTDEAFSGQQLVHVQKAIEREAVNYVAYDYFL